MTPHPAVITALQMSLAAHWLALETYRCQAAHFARAGYPRLAAQAAEDVKEEGEHADRLLARLEQFDTLPDTAHPAPVWPRLPDYVGLLQANLALETAAAQVERDGILAARAVADERTAALLAENLEGSEASVVQLEAALRTIATVGVDQYLAAMV